MEPGGNHQSISEEHEHFGVAKFRFLVFPIYSGGNATGLRLAMVLNLVSCSHNFQAEMSGLFCHSSIGSLVVCQVEIRVLLHCCHPIDAILSRPHDPPCGFTRTSCSTSFSRLMPHSLVSSSCDGDSVSRRKIGCLLHMSKNHNQAEAYLSTGYSLPKLERDPSCPTTLILYLRTCLFLSLHMPRLQFSAPLN